MGKIILEGKDAILLAGELNSLPELELSGASEMVDAFIDRVETTTRYNTAIDKLGYAMGPVAYVEVDEETLTWICVMLEKAEGKEW